jgi:hypothetical protein
MFGMQSGAIELRYSINVHKANGEERYDGFRERAWVVIARDQ